MIKQYNVTVNGTTYEVTVASAAGGRMASAPVSRAAAAKFYFQPSGLDNPVAERQIHHAGHPFALMK